MVKTGDQQKLREWLGARKSSLERARLPYESLWSDIRSYFEPTLGKALSGSQDQDAEAAKRDDEKLITSYTRSCVTRLSAGLQSGITNQARQWFRLDTLDDRPKKERSMREYLDRTTQTLQGIMARSNAYQSLDKLYAHLGLFGTACALIVPDDDTIIRMLNIDEGAYWIAEDRKGRVNTLLRRCEYTVAQIVDEFGLESVPKRVADMWNKGETTQYERVWNLIFPIEEMPKGVSTGSSDSGFAYRSIYWMDETDRNEGVLDVRGYSYNPIIAPRWTISSGTAYGVGCGQIALPNAKGLQALYIDLYKFAKQQVDPALAAPESMRTEALDTGPGAVNYYKDNVIGTGGGRVPIQRLFETNETPDAILNLIGQIKSDIDREFYADVFQMLMSMQMGDARHTMTATEVSELASEKMALIGPILTRLNHDLLDPLVEAVYSLAWIHGEDLRRFSGEDSTHVTDLPDSLDAENIKVEYQSSLHMEQMSTTRLTGIVHLQQFALGFAQLDPQALDWIDGDKIMEIAGESFMEFGAVRSKKDVEAIREGRAAQQEQQMQLAQQAGNVDAARQTAAMMKDLSDARREAGGGDISSIPGGM